MLKPGKASRAEGAIEILAPVGAHGSRISMLDAIRLMRRDLRFACWYVVINLYLAKHIIQESRSRDYNGSVSIVGRSSVVSKLSNLKEHPLTQESNN